LRTVFYISGKVAEEINYKNNLKMVLQNILKKGCSRRFFKNNIYNGLAILAMQMAILFQRTICKW
jgi:antitoxin component YwqK of YwqJK toxin-antitoxin module